MPPRVSLGFFGDQVCLFSADEAGRLTGYGRGLAFAGARDGVSYGRHVNRTFSVQLTDNLKDPLWFKLVDLHGQSVNRVEISRAPAQTATRFHRAVTPAQPQEEGNTGSDRAFHSVPMGRISRWAVALVDDGGRPSEPWKRTYDKLCGLGSGWWIQKFP